jgi:hypothetical protein
MALRLTVDFVYDDDLFYELNRIAQRFALYYRVEDFDGPAGGWPVVELIGAPQDIKNFIFEFAGSDVEASLELIASLVPHVERP